MKSPPQSEPEQPVFTGPDKENEPPLTARESELVDDRQDQLMARNSVDGQPPTHQRRLVEWRWLLIVGPVVLIGGVVFAITRGVSIAALTMGIVFVLGYLLLAGWPSLGAAVLRGKEERAARKQAVIEVRPMDKPAVTPR